MARTEEIAAALQKLQNRSATQERMKLNTAEGLQQIAQKPLGKG